MSRKTRDILKSRGYTDQELEGMSTLLNDPKFCSAIEAEAEQADILSAKVAAQEEAIKKNEDWYKDYAIPEVDKARAETIASKRELAATKAELEAMQSYGLGKIAAQQGHEPAVTPAAKETMDKSTVIDESRFVQTDQFGKFAEQVPYSLAMLNDISEEHRELFGARIPGGSSKLVADWDNARKTQRYQGSLRDYYEQQFKVQDKRNEIEAKKKEEYENKIREEERNKVLSEYGGNPNLRPMVLSRSPFTNRTAATGTDGKPVNSGTLPWEKSKEQRSAERVSKFTTQHLQQSVQ